MIQWKIFSRIAARILILLILFNAAGGLSAGHSGAAFLKVDYLWIEPARVLQMLQEVENRWSDVQQRRLDRGELTEWRFYRVVSSGHPSRPYNFVSVEVGAGLHAFQQDVPLSDRFLMPYVVHTEFWQEQAATGLSAGEDEAPARYMNANYMKAAPGMLDEYLILEVDVAMPLHENQVANGRMEAWAFHRLVFPTGATAAYNYITTDYYSHLPQIEMGITSELIARVHPQLDVDEFEEYADSIRTRVWSDLWELIVCTVP